MNRLRHILPIALFLVSFATAAAQDSTVPDSAKHADVIRLLRASGSAELGVQMMDNLLPSFAEAFPQVPEQLWDEIRQEFSADELIGLMVPIYEKYYSHEEIRELLAFYESPIGKKMVERMPLVLQEAMMVGEQWGEKTAEKILNRLEEKGYRRM